MHCYDIDLMMNGIPLTDLVSPAPAQDPNRVFHVGNIHAGMFATGVKQAKLKPGPGLPDIKIAYCTWSLWLPTIYKALSTFIKSERFWHGALRRPARNVASEKRRETCQNLEVLPDPAVRRGGRMQKEG